MDVNQSIQWSDVTNTDANKYLIIVHGRIQSGVTGGPDPHPEKSQKYRVS